MLVGASAVIGITLTLLMPSVMIAAGHPEPLLDMTLGSVEDPWPSSPGCLGRGCRDFIDLASSSRRSLQKRSKFRQQTVSCRLWRSSEDAALFAASADLLQNRNQRDGGEEDSSLDDVIAIAESPPHVPALFTMYPSHDISLHDSITAPTTSSFRQGIEECFEPWSGGSGGGGGGGGDVLPIDETIWRRKHEYLAQELLYPVASGGNSPGGNRGTTMRKHIVDPIRVGNSTRWTCSHPDITAAVLNDGRAALKNIINMELVCWAKPIVVSSGGTAQRPMMIIADTSARIEPERAGDDWRSCFAAPMNLTSSSSSHHPSLTRQQVHCRVVFELTRSNASAMSQSRVALQASMAFLFFIAAVFLATMVYLIASPSYRRNVAKRHMTKKLDDLENWVAEKEQHLHREADEDDQDDQQAHDAALVGGGDVNAAQCCRSSEEGWGGTSRHARLVARGAAPGGADTVLHNHGKPPQASLHHRRRNAALPSASSTNNSAALGGASSSAVYQNPERLTLGELLQHSKEHPSTSSSTSSPPYRASRAYRQTTTTSAMVTVAAGASSRRRSSSRPLQFEPLFPLDEIIRPATGRLVE